MAHIIVVGDGPAGLSAALFLARNGHEVEVFGGDKTAVHYALLHNYLGVDEVRGPDFQAAAREQVARVGARLHDGTVTEVARDGDRFTVRTDDGRGATGDHLVVANGKAARRLLEQIGAEVGERGAAVVDTEYRTTVDRVYAVGRAARPDRSQVVISAGAGATAALDILAREAGKDVVDWDSLDRE